ncbi:MAG: DUF2293 domain-containing protein [Akkermansiaceae bacterium]|jgi:hypothetical protein|nr:DUF2293 domain-containing protein [Akkermansiaceae bacterium]MDP4646485.1 DUF2293 domain-containing protein [Akkermansiaceae bacterium]MDP4719653.1 DUF2293 domain-containing protein [Akkermansiaceae bacterium]MDP4780093.1 DUF2293 domain-containing protein [Akkermansiaceae bacterium]MDP4847686.1 DUF2293 domain-containing protein [Akkermansiaceae bacterium]
MSHETLDVRPGKRPGFVFSQKGEEIKIPAGWALLPPGDAALSRRIKKDGPSWTVKEMYKKRLTSRGIWAPAERIEALRGELEAEREDPAYAKKLEAGRQRRAKAEVAYVEDFTGAVREFLWFDDRYSALADRLSLLIAAHATPVGSGTVARTKRIPIEKRAEAATIAWLRHQTTSYDEMHIERVKGRRREVRQMLAEVSRKRLRKYRVGEDVDKATCPVWKAVTKQ